MLLMTCPYCGVEAEETELSPGGEAHLKRFSVGSSDDEFEAYLFQRENPKGLHFERWRHSFGCGKWFHAARCTMSLEVFGPIRRKVWPLLKISKTPFLQSALAGRGGSFRDVFLPQF